MKKSTGKSLTNKSKSKRHWILRVSWWLFIWVILPLLIFYAFIAVVHPERKLLQHTFNKLEDEQGVRIKYNHLTMTPSFGLRFDDLIVEQVRPKNYDLDGQTVTLEPRRFITAKTLEVSAVVTPMLQGKIGLRLRGTAYKGKIDTRFVFSLLNLDAPVEVIPKWNHIDLHDLKADYPDISLEKGISSGDGQLSWDPALLTGYQGIIHLQFDDLIYMIPEKMAGALDVTLIRSANGTIKLQGPQIEITTFWIIGDTADMHLSGTVFRDYRPEKSQLDIDAKLHPHKNNEQRSEDEFIPFTITGTAEKPNVKFMGVNLNDLFDENFNVLSF